MIPQNILHVWINYKEELFKHGQKGIISSDEYIWEVNYFIKNYLEYLKREHKV